MSASPELPWFPKYVDDWMTSEFVLTLDDASYRCYDWLLCHQWKKGDLPKEVSALAAICGKDTRAFRKIWQKLEPVFPINDNHRRANLRMQSERTKQEEKRAVLAQNRLGKTKKPITNDNQTLFNSSTNVPSLSREESRVQNTDITNQYSLNGSGSADGKSAEFSGRIPEREEVAIFFGNFGWSRDRSDLWYDKWDALGWKHNGEPIRSWRSFASKETMRRENVTQDPTQKPKTELRDHPTLKDEFGTPLVVRYLKGTDTIVEDSDV